MSRLCTLLRSVGFGKNRLEFVYEIPYILKFTINTGEAYVCHLVKMTEKFHESCTKNATGKLAFVSSIEFCFKCCDHPFDIIFRNGSFPTCFSQTPFDFIPVKGFFFTVFFHNSEKLPFEPLVCCESFLATEAFSTAAYARTVITSSRVYDSVIVRTTEWTTH
tara:strand:+ start:3018 stop:3506 length:489 start_codon:yes stop_codon:yes gene_type:complete